MSSALSSALGPSRKRKRESAVSVPTERGDTIEVRPRRTDASAAGERAPPRETRASKRRRIATHSEIPDPSPALQATTRLSRAPAQVSNESVPPDCCYFCLTRGGNAAYECFKEDGEECCKRCIRDRKKRCRLPTGEEAATIAARCPQCTRRGFKNCNGGSPCDTCSRNDTPDKCRQPTKREIKHESRPTPSVSIDEPENKYNNGATVAGRSEPTEPSQNSQQVQPTVPEHDHSAEAGSASDQNLVLPEDDATFKMTVSIQNTIEDHDQAEDIHDATMVSDVLPSPPASDDVTTEKGLDASAGGEDLVVEVTEHTPPSDSNTRPRRSRGRVSYVQIFEDELSDAGPSIQEEEEEDSDTYTSPTTDDEIESEDSEPALSDDEASLTDSDADMSEDMLFEGVDVAEEEEPVVTSRKPRKQKKNASPSQNKADKGIDLSLPPLCNISDIFADLAAKAAQLGLCKALDGLKGRPINIATMCSGTESPLLALDLLSKALHQAGLPPIPIKHHFSAEIDVIKQGYIERNFQPELLFRDIRDFIPKGATTATTAYGAEVAIPSGLDMLIAGFVCKDLSRKNNNGKGLDDDGESGDTWRAVYKYAERFRPSIVLLENVKAKKEIWDDVVARWEKIGYAATWVYCDTKNYYLPQTRERMYMIAIERSLFGKPIDRALGEWEDSMKKLRRQCSSPYEVFFPGLMHESNDHSVLLSEHDWGLCKLRYDHIRSDERLVLEYFMKLRYCYIGLEKLREVLKDYRKHWFADLSSCSSANGFVTGILRSLTRWSETGTVAPPDFANRKWYQSQSSRVYDAIDVAHLQAAQKGYDSMHKMAVWDVSQNVDRFRAPLGILPCISPDGCDFASNSHQALNGKQLLVLQGMPLDKLLFARETQKDCQDLAGNAMSTTVIGASLISAIICGWRSFRPDPSSALQSTTRDMIQAAPTNTLATHAMKQQVLCPNEFGQLDIQDLKQQAMLSARLCRCEGDKSICTASVLRCSACGHTACDNCAGNPKHAYSIAYPKGSRSLTPVEFVNEWRSRLPTRLNFPTFPDLRKFASEAMVTDQTSRAFAERMAEVHIESQYFCLSNFSRQDNAWTALYNSPQSRLELSIGHDIHWLLFVKCAPNIPGNSPLRKLLEGPVARAHVTNSLLNAEWHLLIPSSKVGKLQISGSTERSSSWRNRLGLPDHKAETVPMTIKIHNDPSNATSLAGDYEFLPHCGTACGCLYKSTLNTPPLYMFLDPNPIGKSDSDSFVFSQDCTRKHFGGARISSAYLDPSWRPWDLDDSSLRNVDITMSGAWVPAALKLKSMCPSVKATVLSATQSLELLQHGCSQVITFLSVHLPEPIPTEDFSDYSWAFEQAKLLPSFSNWQPFDASFPEQCSCAPTHPHILWSVNEKGIATPHEDRKAAAAFERGIKGRPPIFQMQSASSTDSTQIQVGINLSSLVHRAHGRLAHIGSVSTVWRLATDHGDLPPEPFPRFRLESNAGDAPYALPLALKYLRGAQPRSLSWMVAQESGTSITIREIEEAIHPGLGWRAEAQAQINLTVRGGVLADLPSFGKTVTTIALIQSEFEQHGPGAILRRNKELGEKLPALIDSAATLIVCPPHIAMQWQFELEKFLGERYNIYNVLLVESFDQLQRLTMDELRDSRVIILSWNVFAEEEYISQLARFTAMPEPTTASRRGFDAWFGRVIDEIPSQLDEFQGTDFEDFQKSTRDLLEERLQHGDFQAALPIKIQHGSAYQSFRSMQKASSNAKGSSKKSKAQLQRKASSAGTESQVPLLHLFRFNRIVVDEYHYLNDDKKTSNMVASVSVKKVAAHKRWVLSGTPALANFTDVDQIASYLGIKLGRNFFGDGMVTTQLEKARKSDQTLVEDFLSQTDIMSRQWHQARHERAQEFLDLFVRQNEAELQHIACSEEILPIELDTAHHAVYLELSQHLISQRMQIKKLSNKSSSDRTDRLNASLNNSATAEDALLRSALLFETLNGECGLKLLVQKRLEQCRHTEKELAKLMAGLESLKKDEELTKLYGRFKKDIKGSNWLGDKEAMETVRRLLLTAERSPSSKAFPELRGLSEVKTKQHTKKLLSQLRELSRELALRKRSERFPVTIQDIVQQSSHGAEDQTFNCSSPECKGTANLSQLYLVAHCGHTACENCLGVRTDDESCVHPSCNLSVQTMNLIKMSDLGTTRDHGAGERFGKKLGAVARLIKKLPDDEQGLVFAPNEETIRILETVFDHHGLSYHSASLCRPAAAAKIIEDFKSNKDHDEQKKVLILNLGSESAAGINLVNANHIIFVSPLLAKSQYEYDSAMVQAIARSRRYGQEKKVHIYHVVAQRTIDVDILEHRHKRSDGITTSKSTLKMPMASIIKKEKTKLVKNNAGQMALVPASWLADKSKRQILDIGETPDSFTSLITFSETFEHDDD